MTLDLSRREGMDGRLLAGAVMALIGGVIQAYVGYLTLPDEFASYLVAGIAVGLAVGHWVVFVAALPTAVLYSGYAIKVATPENDFWQVVWFGYVPAALLSLAVGVAVRKVAGLALRRVRS